MENKEMCRVITPYVCPNCGNALLFFTSKNNRVIDYKGFIDASNELGKMKNILYSHNVKTLKCIGCKHEYIIDWSNGWPVPLTDRNVLKRFGYKFKG